MKQPNYLKNILFVIGLVALVFFVVLSISKFIDVDSSGVVNKSEDGDILKANVKDESEAALTVVTFGKRPEYEDVFYIQSESLGEEELDEAIEEHRYLIFDEENFIKHSETGFVRDMLSEGKTVMFHDTAGEGLNIEEIVDKGGMRFPHYNIEHDEELYVLMYGYGYSKEYNAVIPISVLSNTLDGDKDREKMSYLIEHDLEHWGNSEKEETPTALK